MVKILVTGSDGLLSHALQRLQPPGFEFIILSHSEFDLTRPVGMEEKLHAIGPQVVINTAAYNLVDRCEQERDQSWAVNATGPQSLARMCAGRSIRMVHYSTDYVFDGTKKAPYEETDTPNPLNHYGAGKLAGECATLDASPGHLVLRTSWLFGPHPSQNKSYVHKILHLARNGKELKGTIDQIAVPTFVDDLARWTIELIRRNAGGLFHATNEKTVSRYAWTKIILSEAEAARIIDKVPAVKPVRTAYFNASMQRPGYSVLSNKKLTTFLGHPLGSWRKRLLEMLTGKTL